MKFGQLIQCNKRNIFLQNHGENEAGRLIPDLFLFFKKLYEVKAMAGSLVSVYFDGPKFGIE